MEIIKKIPTALNNLNIPKELQPHLLNYIQNLIIEVTAQTITMTPTDYKSFIKNI